MYFPETEKALLAVAEQSFFHDPWVTSGYTDSTACGHPAQPPTIPEVARISSRPKSLPHSKGRVRVATKCWPFIGLLGILNQG